MRCHFWLQRRCALLLDGRLVHAGGVIVAHFLFDGGVLPRGLSLLQDVAQDIEIVLIQLVEAAPAGFVGWDGVVLHPGSAGILIEIHAGIGGLIHGGHVEAGDLFGKLGRRRTRGCGLRHGQNGSKQHRESQDHSDPHFCLAEEMSPRCKRWAERSQRIGPRASRGGRKLAKHTTGNTTTRAIRLGNSCQVSRNKVLLPLKRASGGWSSISWGLCGRPRSGFVFPPVIGRHCCTTKDLPGICRRCLRLCPAGQRCCSGG